MGNLHGEFLSSHKISQTLPGAPTNAGPRYTELLAVWLRLCCSVVQAFSRPSALPANAAFHAPKTPTEVGGSLKGCTTSQHAAKHIVVQAFSRPSAGNTRNGSRPDPSRNRAFRLPVDVGRRLPTTMTTTQTTIHQQKRLRRNLGGEVKQRRSSARRYKYF